MAVSPQAMMVSGETTLHQTSAVELGSDSKRVRWVKKPVAAQDLSVETELKTACLPAAVGDSFHQSYISMKIKCPACSKVLSIPESAAGKIVKCPCGKQLRAPGGGAAPQPAGTGPAGKAAGRPAPGSTGTGRPTPSRPTTGGGDFDPGMFDELTDQDLQPVKGVVNPYSPVSSQAGGGAFAAGRGQGSREIAGVGSRIAGALVDGLFTNLFVGIGIGVAYLLFFASGQEPTQTQIYLTFAIVGVAALIPVIINIVLISKSGQSLGKKVVGTRMVDQETYDQVGVVQGYLIRSIGFGLITGLPFVGGFIAIADIIYLFIGNHQTLHDKLAKTLVVTA